MSGPWEADGRGAELLGRAVIAAALALEDAEDELCRLDSVAGDGDEGLGMARAARGTRERLSTGPVLEISSIVELVGRELSAIGGAMGAVSYVVLSAIREDLRARGSGPFTAGRLAEILAVAEDTLSEFGGAQRGDKSLLDSIACARDAAQEATQEGASLEDALLASAAAARKGANDTANMEARVGRAARLGPRSLGSIDAGAQSFAIVITALSEVYAGRRPENIK